MSIKKKVWKYLLLLPLARIMPCVFALNPQTIWEIDQLFSNLLKFEGSTAAQTPPSKKEILTVFCQSALNPELSNGFNLNDSRYSAHQSIFLALLCSTTKTLPAESFSPLLADKQNGYLLPFSLEKHYQSKGKLCETNTLEHCDLARISYLLIRDTLSELFTLKQAQIYGINTNNFTSPKELQKSANLYAKTHFFSSKSTDPTEGNFCKGQKHNYPQTCKLLINNLKSFQKALKELKIISIKNFYKESLETLEDIKKAQAKNQQHVCTKNPQDPEKFNHHFCNILALNQEWLFPFITHIYNELLRYSLFTKYFHQQRSLGIHLPDYSNDELWLQVEKIGELNQMLKYQQEILESTNKTLEQLADLSKSYPLHIGLLLYQEDLLRLRDNSLSKLVNPFYSLYYKLQNVQIKK